MKSFWKAYCLNSLSHKLNLIGEAPNSIELTEYGGIFFTTVFNKLPEKTTIHLNSCVGISICQHTSALIALTEWAERKVARSNKKKFPHGTDGVAGWDVPLKILKSGARKKARVHAIKEACERNIWSRWWDLKNCGEDVIAGENIFGTLDKHSLTLITFINSQFPGGSFQFIRPFVSNEYPFQLVIVCFVMPNKSGVITGGAADTRQNLNSAILHALGELLRHCLAVKGGKGNNLIAQNDYEKRLFWMASEDGALALNKRLSLKGRDLIPKPPVAIDTEIEEDRFPFLTFWQYQFKHHPEFIGSEIERCCL